MHTCTWPSKNWRQVWLFVDRFNASDLFIKNLWSFYIQATTYCILLLLWSDFFAFMGASPMIIISDYISTAAKKVLYLTETTSPAHICCVHRFIFRKIQAAHEGKYLITFSNNNVTNKKRKKKSRINFCYIDSPEEDTWMCPVNVGACWILGVCWPLTKW